MIFLYFNRQNGWIYEKEAILEYILHKKIENSKLMKQFARQKEEKNKELNELAEIQYKEKLDKFLKTEGKLVSSSIAPATSKQTNDASVCNMKEELKHKLPSFWIPSLCPESTTKVQMKKPVNFVKLFYLFNYLFKSNEIL